MMEQLKNPQMLQLAALLVAFFLGLAVCIYVAFKEGAELRRRRAAKQLMYKDAVAKQVAIKKAERIRAAEQITTSTDQQARENLAYPA